jgi:integrase
MLLSLMGLRPAEVCGVRWIDVDLTAETLRIETTRTLVGIDGPMVVVEKGPKSEAGRRTLPLPAPCRHGVEVAEGAAGPGEARRRP